MNYYIARTWMLAYTLGADKASRKDKQRDMAAARKRFYGKE